MPRKERIYEFNGEFLTTKAISERYRIPCNLVWNCFNRKNYPDLQTLLTWRKENNKDRIDDYSTCLKVEGVKYSYGGEELTAYALSKKLDIPEICIKKAFNDPTYPNLDQIIRFRKENNISGLNDYRCRSLVKLKNKFDENKQNTEQRSINNTGLNVDQVFGSYKVISRRILNRKSFISVFCLECGTSFYDIPLALFIKLVENNLCICNKLWHLNSVKHLPSSILKNTFDYSHKGLSYYKSFIGYSICGIKITSVSKKENNDGEVFIFSGTCPKCGSSFNTLAFNLITGIFRHKCVKRKKNRIYKNTSCMYINSKRLEYSSNYCKLHRDMSQEMKEMIQNHISFYTLVYGTEDFMNLCIDADLEGNGDYLRSLFAI